MQQDAQFSNSESKGAYTAAAYTNKGQSVFC
jgi:hypothetical protein